MIQSGLVFLAIALGCLIGFLLIGVSDRLLYQPKATEFPLHQIPAEYRLYPAMAGSLVLPVSLFWFGWTVQARVHPAAPIVAVVLFGVGNIGLFISCLQYGTWLCFVSNPRDILRNKC